MSPIYDTHAFVKRLSEAGMPEKQAEVVAYEQAQLMIDHLATKEDLAAVEASLRQEIKDVQAEMKAGDEALRASIDSLRMEMKAGDDLLRVELTGSINSLRAEMAGSIRSLQAEMKAIENRLLIKLGSMMVALATGLAAFLKYFG